MSFEFIRGGLREGEGLGKRGGYELGNMGKSGKVLLGDHLNPIRKHFYPDGRGLCQDFPAHTHMA